MSSILGTAVNALLKTYQFYEQVLQVYPRAVRYGTVKWSNQTSAENERGYEELGMAGAVMKAERSERVDGW